MKSHKSINHRTKKNSLARTRKTKHSNAKRISKKTHRGGAQATSPLTAAQFRSELSKKRIITGLTLAEQQANKNYKEYKQALNNIFNINAMYDDDDTIFGTTKNKLGIIISVKDNDYYNINMPYHTALKCFTDFQEIKQAYVRSQEIKNVLSQTPDVFQLFNTKISENHLDKLVFTNFISILNAISINENSDQNWFTVYYKYKYDKAKKTIQYKDENPLNGIECLKLADKFLNSLYENDKIIVSIDYEANKANKQIKSIEQSGYEQNYYLINTFIDVSIVCIILFNEFDNNPLNDDNTALQDQFDVLVNTYKVMDTQNNIKHNTLSEILTNKTENTDINIINNTNAEVEILMLFEKGPLNSILEFLYNKFSNKKINDYKLGKNVTHEFFLKTYSSFKQQYTSNGTDTKLPEDFTIQVAHQILNIL